MSAFTPDFLLANPGRRPSGARLYHRGSRFGPPERRKLDRNLIAKILFLAEALDRRTRQPRQHGGALKEKGQRILRTLLTRFYNHLTGECFPGYDEIAAAAGCCRATVAAKLRVLEAYGFLKTIRRIAVEKITSRVHRVSFTVTVQTSNSYVFNLPVGDRAEHGDTGLPLLKPKPAGQQKAESKFQAVTIKMIEREENQDLEADKARALAALFASDTGG